MASWYEYLRNEGRPPAWPYPVSYEKEQEIEADVLVLGRYQARRRRAGRRPLERRLQ
jgi:hypothetical protein